MPVSLVYLGIMLVVICLWFIVVKRPVYEAIGISFLLLLTITGNWGNIWTYVNDALSTSLLYSMVAFVAMSILLTKTKVIDSCIAVILSLLGRISGGAGYASVVASSFVGALSGSGPGNVMATGTITIPAMKKSGFPPELAANVESNASCMGNMIPPSSNIVAALGAFVALYPDNEISQGEFWIILWGISIWFIIQRLVMVFSFCKYYDVKPMPKEELPSLKETLRVGWKALFLPVIILLPFVLDYFFKDTLFTARLGADGAKALSGSILMFAGGVASIYAMIIAKDKKAISPKALAKMFADSIKSISPTIGVCVFSYMIGSLFGELNVADELGAVIQSWNFGRFGMVIAVCVITCIIGMVIPGSSMIAIFGPAFIASLVSGGVDPLLAAAMLPCICGVMSQITPPLGLCMYAGMTIAESDFTKTFKNNLWWVATQFIIQIAILMGWLPIMGL